MPFTTSRRVGAILALVGTLTACTGLEEVCNLIGCNNGLTVNLSSVPIGAFSVEVIPEGPPGTMTYRINCDGSALSCGSRLFFRDVFVERAHVRVVSSRGTVTHALGRVRYNTTFPNGPQCEPACRQATVTVGIPE